ncbi:hypothetical protein JIN84_01810 [Luteolibacter yonseiensis]|uniref:Uncharacterized protein n=1 Tax=Luteolibacter yonseiensis TaxID=1144680 RepID=A0A934VAF8_9BACT|nr:hypothetical protein [Luteolibacter yonseiensis]MBK1814329.1 hypothetical protein [Luteolibacter yonseiensis]
MRTSLSLTLVLLAVIVPIGWKNHHKIQHALDVRQRLEKETAGSALDSGPGGFPTKRPRETRSPDAGQLTADILAFLKEPKKPAPDGKDVHLGSLSGRIRELNAGELKQLVADLNSTDLPESGDRENLMRISLRILTEKSPQQVPLLFSQMPDLYKRLAPAESIVAAALGEWAKRDSSAAVEWFRENSKQHPERFSALTGSALVRNASEQDPTLMFKFIRELGVTELSMDRLVPQSGKTPEGRTSILKALREHLATLPDKAESEKIQSQVLGEFVRQTVYEGYPAATRWLESSRLEPEELAVFARHLGSCGMYDETGKWTEWMSRKLPPAQASETIQTMVASWSRTHYKAAGQWLATAPEGPAKTAAIRGYVETVSRHDPMNAAQWAMTLPAGNDRDSTLRLIHQNWPEGDSPERDAFAKKHGID